MARLTDDLFSGVFEFLFELAAKSRSPWAWLAASLWAAPFLYFAYRIRTDGGATVAIVVCLCLAALPFLVRLWVWVRRRLSSS